MAVIYYTQTRWSTDPDYLRIKEAEVLKETDNQYIVVSDYQRRVNKKDMVNGTQRFFATYDIAVEWVKQRIKDCIGWNENDISRLNKENDMLKELLDSYERARNN